MKKGLTLLALLSITLAMTACASLKPPERPNYAGPDTVTSAQPAQLVGIWSVTDLNPYPGNGPQDTVIEYRADGSVLGTLTPQGEGADALGNMQFKLAGQWVLSNDVITHQNMTMNSTSDNAFGGIVSKMINKQKGISGQANIHELSPERIVMVGSDGAAMEYVRK